MTQLPGTKFHTAQEMIDAVTKSNKNYSKLMSRYCECDSRGHEKPIKAENLCGHCYRPLDWGKYATELNELYDSGSLTKDLPMMMRPMNAPIVAENARKKQKQKELFALTKGLELIAQEK